MTNHTGIKYNNFYDICLCFSMFYSFINLLQIDANVTNLAEESNPHSTITPPPPPPTSVTTLPTTTPTTTPATPPATPTKPTTGTSVKGLFF